MLFEQAQQVKPFSNILNRQQTNKPAITFTYNQIRQSPSSSINFLELRSMKPMQTTSAMTASPSIDLAKQGIMLTLSHKQFVNPRTGRRNKIFSKSEKQDRKSPVARHRSWINDFENKQRKQNRVSSKNLQTPNRNRRNIFEPYKRKTKDYSEQFQQPLYKNIHLFPLKLKNPQHPRSLINYVDISVHRKNPSFSSNIPKDATYVESGFHKQEREEKFKLHQAASLSDIDVEESISAYSNKEVNNSNVEINALLESQHRFFDKEINFISHEPNPPERRSYNEVQLFKTNLGNEKTDQRELTSNSLVQKLIQKITQIFEKSIIRNYFLPFLLIVLGIMLLLIQSLK